MKTSAANTKVPAPQPSAAHHKTPRKSVPHLADELRSSLRRSSPALGAQFKSINQICAEYGSSPVTSQKALKVLEQEGLLYSVKGSGSYVRQLPAPDLSAHRRIGLSFLLPGFGGSNEVAVAFQSFADSAAEELRTVGRQITNLSRSDLQNPSLAKAELAELDGLVMSIGCYDRITAPMLEEWGKPVVVIQHEEPQNFPLHQVIPNLLPGCRLAAQELLRGGVHEVIVVCDGSYTHQYRNRIFREALAGLAPQMAVREIAVERISCDMGRLTGRKLGEQILAGSLPTAVFSPSDFLSFGIVDVLREQRVALGREVRLVSFDNLEGDGLLPFGEAVLTSIVNPRRRIAQEAARLLLHQLEVGGDLLQTVRVPLGLVKRGSSGD